MYRIPRKGLSAALLVCLLATPVAAAAPMERVDSGEAPSAAGWFDRAVDWVGGWLSAWKPLPERPRTEAGGERERPIGAATCDGGGTMDPNGAC